MIVLRLRACLRFYLLGLTLPSSSLTTCLPAWQLSSSRLVYMPVSISTCLVCLPCMHFCQSACLPSSLLPHLLRYPPFSGLDNLAFLPVWPRLPHLISYFFLPACLTVSLPSLRKALSPRLGSLVPLPAFCRLAAAVCLASSSLAAPACLA
jgi:hypothetical protein